MHSARYGGTTSRNGEKVGETGSKLNNLGSTEPHPTTQTVITLPTHNHFNCFKMHIIPGLKKRCLAPSIAVAAQVAAAKPAAKKLTATEMREAEKRAGEQEND